MTGEGDRLNLKSKLCQYVIFSKIFNNSEISDIELVTSNPEDTMKFIDFMNNSEM